MPTLWTRQGVRRVSKGKANCPQTGALITVILHPRPSPICDRLWLCNVATAAYSAGAETSGAVTAVAEMSQRRDVPVPKRSAPRRWRRNGGAEMSWSGSSPRLEKHGYSKHHHSCSPETVATVHHEGQPYASRKTSDARRSVSEKIWWIHVVHTYTQ